MQLFSGCQAARLLSRLETLTLLEDDIVKKTTTAEIMAKDNCDQNDTHAIRLQACSCLLKTEILCLITHHFYAGASINILQEKVHITASAARQPVWMRAREWHACPLAPKNTGGLKGLVSDLMPYASCATVPSTAPAADFAVT